MGFGALTVLVSSGYLDGTLKFAVPCKLACSPEAFLVLFWGSSGGYLQGTAGFGVFLPLVSSLCPASILTRLSCSPPNSGLFGSGWSVAACFYLGMFWGSHVFMSRAPVYVRGWLGAAKCLCLGLLFWGSHVFMFGVVFG